MKSVSRGIMNAFSVFTLVSLAVSTACGVVQVTPSGASDGTDSAAINAAVAAAAEGDGKVQLTDGVYNLTEPIMLTSSVEIAGNDADRSRVVLDGAGKYRQIEINAEGALIHGVTFANGYSDKTSNWAYGPVYINNGMVSNCTVRSGRGKYTGAVCLTILKANTTAKIVDSLIYDCTGADGGGAGIGGGLRFLNSSSGASSIAENCIVSNCWQGAGYAVYINSDSAKLIGSTICAGSKGGVSMVRNGLVSNCVVRANAGSGVYMTGGTVANSLITGNSAENGGGVYKTGGKLIHCTVAGNSATVAGSGVYQTGGEIKDSVIWNNNASVYLSSESSLALNGGTCLNTCAAAAPSGNGNINDRLPGFVDAAAGDYILTASSPCIGSASDGSDIGCFRYSAPALPRASIAYVISDGVAPASVSFAANLEGYTGEILSYMWSFGDGTTAESTDGASVTHVFAEPGRYTVSVSVDTSAAGVLSASIENAVNLGADTVYVRPDGNGQFPYSTPATAACDIQAAIDAVVATEARPGRVILAESASPYLLGSNSRFAISRPVEVIGAGPGKSVIDCRQASGKTGFLLQHDKALVSSLTVHRGQWSSRVGGGGANIESGTISNCLFTSCKGAYNGSVYMYGRNARLIDTVVSGGVFSDGGGAGMGGAVYMTSGLVSGCVISNSYGASQGGGIYASGGTVTNTYIGDCYIYGGNGAGGGLYLAGATATDVTVENCRMTKNGGTGGGGVYIASGTLQDSTVSNCVSSYKDGGGIYMANGTLLRTVVSECISASAGGGLYMAKGTADHCTVARNNAVSSGSGIQIAGGVLKNSISAANGYKSGCSPAQISITGGTVEYSCIPDYSGGTGNISADPVFRSAEKGDFRLSSSSPCIEAAADGTDMGAIPYVFDPDAMPSVVITVSTDSPVKPVNATITANVDGSLPGEITGYRWNMGDGTVLDTDGNTVAYLYDACGSYTVSVTITVAGGQPITASKADAVVIYPDVTYVDAANGNPVPPYDTPEKAANRIGDAVDAVFASDERYGTVYVAAGEYPLTANTEFLRNRNIQLKSASGRRDVVIVGNGKALQFNLSAKDALVSGIEARDVAGFSGTWGVFVVYDGTVTNCAVVKCNGAYAGGAHVSGANAKVLDSYFERGSSGDPNGGGRHSLGAMLIENGGFVNGCVVTNCSATSNAGAIQITGGTLSRTLITGCTGRGRTLFVQGGLVDSCRIEGNFDNGNGGEGVGIFATGGTVRQCLVTGNVTANVHSGIRVDGNAIVENCTVADNTGKTAGFSSSSAGKWYNCLSWGNSGAEGADLAGGALYDHCLIGVNPKFRRPESGDYRVLSTSPARNGGVERPWMSTALDLQGNPRILNKRPDIGCYEDLSGSMFLMLR